MKANVVGANVCFPKPSNPVQLRLLQLKQLWLTSIRHSCKIFCSKLFCIETREKKILPKLAVVHGKHPGQPSWLAVIKLVVFPCKWCESARCILSCVVFGVVSTVLIVAACMLHWQTFLSPTFEAKMMQTVTLWCVPEWASGTAGLLGLWKCHPL